VKRLALIAACALPFACSRAWALIPYYEYEIYRPVVDLDLSYRMETYEQTREGRTTKRETHALNEKLELWSGGWLYHPQVFNFSLQLRPEFEQYQSRPGAGEPLERTTTFLGFTVDANVLSYKPYSLNLHARRDSRDIAASRAELDSTLESSLYRARLNAKHPVVPTVLTLESRERVHDLFLATRTERAERLHVRSLHRTEASQTRLVAELQERSSRRDDTEVTSEHTVLTVDNRYQPGDRSRAVTRLRHDDRTAGEASSTITALTSRLDVEHHERLESRYLLEYDDQRLPDSELSRVYGSGWLRHQLYESLTTTLSADLESREATDAELESYGAALRFGYTKAIPWGRLDADLGRIERYTDIERLLTVAQVRAEPHELKGTGFDQRVPLGSGRREVDVATVRVRDQFFRFYCPADAWPQHEDCQGVDFPDYEREEVGGRVYIWAVGGRLAEDLEAADGGVVSVWVDYEHETDPSVEMRQSTDAFGIAVDLWSRLRLYYRQSDSAVKIISGEEPEETEHSSRLVGTQLRLGWGPVRSTTTLETAERETARLQTWTDRARQEVGLRIGRWSATALSAELEDETADETVEDATGGDTRVHTNTLTQTLRAAQQFTFGGWSTTAFEAEDVSIRGDLTERTRIPSTTLTLRQTFDYRGWSTTDIEAIDTRVKGDLADFPPTIYRDDVTPMYTLRIRQRFALRPTPAMRVGLGATYSERERKDTGTRSEAAGLSASLRWKLGPGNLTARASHDRLEDTTHQTERTMLGATYAWRHGAWRSSIQYTLSDEERRALGGTGAGHLRKDSRLYLQTSRRF
jgi:hypothetical protein